MPINENYDCIDVNEINGFHFLPKKIQFHFLINSIRKRKRFGGKWLSSTKLKNLQYVKEYYEPIVMRKQKKLSTY